jgi:hypothetical protein
MLVPPFAPGEEWAGRLASTLLDPEFHISMWEALGRRLRRNYYWLLALLTLSWSIKVSLHPTPISSTADFLTQAAVGPIDGWWVTLWVAAVNGAALLLGLATAGLRQAAGEVLPRAGRRPSLRRFLQSLREVPSEVLPGSRLRLVWPLVRRERLCIIITSRGDAVADRLLVELRRGVTSLPGVGMYTGEDRSVLLCAIHPTEAQHLKAIVRAVDRNAFLVINPAQEVVGKGFSALD